MTLLKLQNEEIQQILQHFEDNAIVEKGIPKILVEAKPFKGTSKNTISPCFEAAIAYNLDS